jgi:hypothetical protein
VNVVEGRFDERAVHAIVAVPVCVEMTMDVTALADEGSKFVAAMHWIALAYGDKALINGAIRANACFEGIREIARRGADLIENSQKIEPYTAVQFAGVEVVA